MNALPNISVILPVYNAEEYIQEAIESILKQTYTDFELIVINDGSKDATDEVIKSISDPRIKYYTQENIGFAATLNKALLLAKGKYIARMDADDVSLPQRFQKQMDFLAKHPDCALVGTWAEIIDAHGVPSGRYHKHPEDSDVLKYDLFFDNPFVHSSVIFKREVLEVCGSYNEKLHSLVQDFDYWFRIAQKFRIANLPEVLIKYRELNSGISATTKNFSSEVAKQMAVHLNSVMNESSPEFVLMLSNAYHGVEFNGFSNDFKERAFEFFQKLAAELKLPLNVRDKCVLKHSNHLLRVFYNWKIRSTSSSAFERILYKVRRRLLLIKMD